MPPLDRLTSSNNSRATSGYVNASANVQRTGIVPPSERDWNNVAKYVFEYTFVPSGGSSVPPTAGPAESLTFGSNDRPAYDPDIPNNLGSDDGHVAANSLLGMEQFGLESNPLQTEMQIATLTLGQHKNDPQFLQQYLSTLGSSRTASIFSYAASLGNVQTPYNYAGGAADSGQLKQEYHNIADALSTLVKSGSFRQGDMDQFVAQFAKNNPQVNFFAKNVLSTASPQVNQMFYQSAKNYALQNADSSTGQAMAAYAMQALSQTSNPLPQLQSLPKDQFSSLINAAMKGSAAYGNPPTVEEFAKTGVFRAENGQGAPLDGLSNLMFNAAYADIGDPFAPAPLTTDQAHDLQTRFFQTAINTLQSDSSVKSFFNGSVAMKDALAVDFQQGYNSIVKAYSGPDGELSSAGMSAFREFFADAVFTPPPSSYGLGTVQMVKNNLASYIAEADKLPSNAKPSQKEIAYAESLGEQAQAMAAGLKESFASILSGSAKADQETKDLLHSLIALGGTGVGLAGPQASVSAAIVGQALNLLVNSSSGSGPSNVQDAVQKLASHGIDVSQYDPGALHDLSTKLPNAYFRTPLQLGLDTGATVLYNS